MDDDELQYEEYEDSEPGFIPAPVRWRWLTIPIIGIEVAEGIGQAMVDGLSALKVVTASYNRYKIEREQFEAEAGRELEMILEGEE